ncbi:MAG: SBBP repeat-containing protein [Pyrinomonadaceae bacterium]
MTYSTFIGGNSGEVGLGITVDPAGNAFLTGNTRSKLVELLTLRLLRRSITERAIPQV